MAAAIVLAPGRDGKADPLKVLETMPASGAKIGGVSSEYFVRFNQPVDHLHSVLLIKHNGSVVETLQPRFKTAPDILFARAPTLQPGDYTFHWLIKTLSGTETTEGEISFSVSQ